MNLPPTVWGPFFWLTIHITALAYPTNPSYTDKRAAKHFFESLANLLPCPVCREHYKQHLTKKPLLPHLDTRKDLFKYDLLHMNRKGYRIWIDLLKPLFLKNHVDRDS